MGFKNLVGDKNFVFDYLVTIRWGRTILYFIEKEWTKPVRIPLYMLTVVKGDPLLTNLSAILTCLKK